MKKDYYQILKVSPDADITEIKRAYRKLALKFHPDHNKDSKAQDTFKEINEAYSILSDQQKRSEYDRNQRYNHNDQRYNHNENFNSQNYYETNYNNQDGEQEWYQFYQNNNNRSTTFSFGNFEDFMSSIFSGFRRNFNMDLKVKVKITFKTFCIGGEINCIISRKIFCSPCYKCQQKGYILESFNKNIQLPSGISSLIFEKEGNVYKNNIGHLYLTFEFPKKYKNFSIDKDYNILYNLNINSIYLYTHEYVSISHIDGRRFSISSKTILNNCNDIIILKNQGIFLSSKNMYSNLIINTTLISLKNLSIKHIEILKSFYKTLSKNNFSSIDVSIKNIK